METQSMAEAAWVKPQVALAEAITAAKLGQRQLARKLLAELVERDPRNESAWLWIAALSEDKQQAMDALVRVLDINPNNQQALNALALARLQESGLRLGPAAQKPAASGNGHHPPAAGQAQAPAPAAGAPAAWACPVCAAPSARAERRCPRCGILAMLAEPEEFAQNKGVNEDAVHQAMQRLQMRLTKQESFADRLLMALCLLNLNRSAEAVPHLKKAAALHPGHAGVERLLEKLSRRRLILAVDDSVTVRKIVSITLERLGYRVLTAADGMQALARLNEETPDLVLLDITMPRMDGYQVCKVIKQAPATKAIPVVMLSGKDGFFDKVKGRLAGATDYITKPFKEATLAEVVEKYTAARTT
jgi:twitching motility two-component system response regulator PilG